MHAAHTFDTATCNLFQANRTTSWNLEQYALRARESGSVDDKSMNIEVIQAI